MYGKQHTKETKKKMSLSHQKDSFIKGKRVMCIETGKAYFSLSDAAKDVCGNSTGRSNIRKYCEGKTNSKIYGYTWKFI